MFPFQVSPSERLRRILEEGTLPGVVAKEFTGPVQEFLRPVYALKHFPQPATNKKNPHCPYYWVKWNK